jgi:UDP-glucose 4-epimerase
MREKVLITGASGFLGYHIIQAAVKEGYEVYAAVRKSSNVKHLQHLSVNYVELNYSDADGLNKLFEEYNFDYVIHAAGTTKANSEAEYDLVNNVYTINLAAAAAKNKKVKRFVFISSLASIGPSKNAAESITENTPRHPVTAYGKSKLNAENNLKKVDIASTVFRPTAIYGPREKDIFIVTKTLCKGIDPYIGRTAQQLSFVYGPDMGDIAVKALKQTGASTEYNITDGKSYSRYAYADIVKAVLNKKAVRFHLPLPVIKTALFVVERINRAMKKVSPVSIEKLNELTAVNWVCDISKARRELGFEPKFDLEKGLKATIDWYKENKWLS